MNNLARLLLAAAVLCAALAVLPTPPARAQTACGDYTCVEEFNFDSDLDGWYSVQPGTVSNWLESKSFTIECEWWEFWCIPSTSTANGVMAVSMNPPFSYVVFPFAKMERWVTLDPGTYKIVTTFANVPLSFDGTASTERNMSLEVYYNNTNNEISDGGNWPTSDEQFREYESETFVVDRATSVRLTAYFTEASVPIYVDYIWVVRTSTSYPTPNPLTPTIPALATAVPMPTEVCRPLATPAPPAFSLTPTATPLPPLYYFNSFGSNKSLGNWSVLAGDVGWVLSPARNVGGLDGGAIRIKFSNSASAITSRNAFAFGISPAHTGPIYINGFVYVSDPIPSGTSVRLEVFYLDGSLNWQKQNEHTVGQSRWQPFHTALPSVSIQGIALAAYRTDTNTTLSLYVDDVTVYDNFTNRPYCNWSNSDGSDNNGAPPELPGINEIVYPVDKPCPPAINEPNNFWGPILTQLTLWADSFFAFSAAYAPGQMTTWVNTFTTQPMALYYGLYATILDFRIAVACMLLMFGAETFRTGWSVWMFLKRTIPFLGGG